MQDLVHARHDLNSTFAAISSEMHTRLSSRISVFTHNKGCSEPLSLSHATCKAITVSKRSLLSVFTMYLAYAILKRGVA